MAKDGLRSPGRVPVDAPGCPHGEGAVAARHRLGNHGRVVGPPGHEGDAAVEGVELANALGPATPTTS